MKKLSGYTLIELMIVIVITSIIITMGISAYGRARDRQAIQATAEQILNILAINQKNANVGNKSTDCIGRYEGQEVSFVAPNKIYEHSLCFTNSQPMPVTPITIDGATFASASVIFKPLATGIIISSNPLLLDITSNIGIVYRLKISDPGTIENLGIQ